MSRLSALGRKGAGTICDATNAEVPGYTPSEKVVGETFDQVFEAAEQRILIATLPPIFIGYSKPSIRRFDTDAKWALPAAACGKTLPWPKNWVF